jgi:ABC-type sulfate transport system permease component
MKPVKQIVMLQGMGNNERGWARLMSDFGRVVLIQQGMIQHVEIWENRQCVFNGAESNDFLLAHNIAFHRVLLSIHPGRNN